MKIYDLNYDTILKILIYLDLDSIHRIKKVNRLFLHFHYLAFKNLNFTAAIILDRYCLKYSYLNNPDVITLNIFNNYKNVKYRFFRNFGNKKNIDLKIKNGLFKQFYSDTKLSSSFNTSSLNFK